MGVDVVSVLVMKYKESNKMKATSSRSWAQKGSAVKKEDKAIAREDEGYGRKGHFSIYLVFM